MLKNNIFIDEKGFRFQNSVCRISGSTPEINKKLKWQPSHKTCNFCHNRGIFIQFTLLPNTCDCGYGKSYDRSPHNYHKMYFCNLHVRVLESYPHLKNNDYPYVRKGILLYTKKYLIFCVLHALNNCQNSLWICLPTDLIKKIVGLTSFLISLDFLNPK